MKIVVDYTLMPENCEERGLYWCGDSIYDSSAPPEVNQNFIEDIKNGCKLGSPASSTQENGGVGIYCPKSAKKDK